jgi:capsular exopolysaccharide synthesis family protein
LDLKGYWNSLRAGWWMALLGLVLGGLLASALVLSGTPQYSTSTRMFVSTTATADLGAAVQGSQFTQQRIASYAAYLTDQQVMSAVIADLGLELSPDELAEMITVDVAPNTVILGATVTDSSPERALAIAQSLSRQFPILVTALEAPEGAADSPVKVTITAQAQLPTEPTAPVPARDIAIGMLLGLLVGATVAVLRDRLDTRIRSSNQAAEVAGAPSLGIVMHDPEIAEKKVLARDAASVVAEEFRQLRTNLDFVDVDKPPRVIVVSSSVAGEGKTTVAVNLAHSLAAAGRTVALVEADLRRPRVTQYLGLVGGVGLTNVLNGSADLDEVLQPVGDGSLVVLASGLTPPNPSELLASDQMRAIIERLSAQFDMVLLDAPPLLAVADTSSLVRIADGTLLCTRWGSTRREELRLSTETLARVGARVFGVVLTMVPRRAAIDEGYGHSYAYTDDVAPQGGRLRGWRDRRQQRNSGTTAEVARTAGEPRRGFLRAWREGRAEQRAAALVAVSRRLTEQPPVAAPPTPPGPARNGVVNGLSAPGDGTTVRPAAMSVASKMKHPGGAG